MPTAATTTALAQISEYLWVVQIGKDNAFNSGSINNGRDTVLYMERKALQYGIDQSLSGLTGVNNYVYSLIGAKLQLANQVLANGSGGVVPTPSGGGGAYNPYPIYITLVSGNISGTTIKALTQPDWYGLSGFAYAFINNNQFALDTNFTYNILTGIFDFALTPYTPQVGDIFTVQAFKAVT